MANKEVKNYFQSGGFLTSNVGDIGVESRVSTDTKYRKRDALSIVEKLMADSEQGFADAKAKDTPDAIDTLLNIAKYAPIPYVTEAAFILEGIKEYGDREALDKAYDRVAEDTEDAVNEAIENNPDNEFLKMANIDKISESAEKVAESTDVGIGDIGEIAMSQGTGYFKQTLINNFLKDTFAGSGGDDKSILGKLFPQGGARYKNLGKNLKSKIPKLNIKELVQVPELFPELRKTISDLLDPLSGGMSMNKGGYVPFQGKSLSPQYLATGGQAMVQEEDVDPYESVADTWEEGDWLSPGQSTFYEADPKWATEGHLYDVVQEMDSDTMLNWGFDTFLGASWKPGGDIDKGAEVLNNLTIKDMWDKNQMRFTAGNLPILGYQTAQDVINKEVGDILSLEGDFEAEKALDLKALTDTVDSAETSYQDELENIEKKELDIEQRRAVLEVDKATTGQEFAEEAITIEEDLIKQRQATQLISGERIRKAEEGEAEALEDVSEKIQSIKDTEAQLDLEDTTDEDRVQAEEDRDTAVENAHLIYDSTKKSTWEKFYEPGAGELDSSLANISQQISAIHESKNTALEGLKDFFSNELTPSLSTASEFEGLGQGSSDKKKYMAINIADKGIGIHHISSKYAEPNTYNEPDEDSSSIKNAFKTLSKKERQYLWDKGYIKHRRKQGTHGSRFIYQNEDQRATYKSDFLNDGTFRTKRFAIKPGSIRALRDLGTSLISEDSALGDWEGMLETQGGDAWKQYQSHLDYKSIIQELV
tara:strand:- start:10622 stop:12910 length:2289 start_codon:yes stop_codon:yes gene_type:complete